MILESLGLGVTSRVCRDPCLLALLILFRSSQDFMPGAAGVEGQFLWLAEDLVLGKKWWVLFLALSKIFPDLFPIANWITLEVGHQGHSHLTLSRLYHLEIRSQTFVSFFSKPSETGLPKHLPSVSYFIQTMLNTSNMGLWGCLFGDLLDWHLYKALSFSFPQQ